MAATEGVEIFGAPGQMDNVSFLLPGTPVRVHRGRIGDLFGIVTGVLLDTGRRQFREDEIPPSVMSYTVTEPDLGRRYVCAPHFVLTR